MEVNKKPKLPKLSSPNVDHIFNSNQTVRAAGFKKRGNSLATMNDSVMIEREINKRDRNGYL